jgi:hypothetical protein
MTKILGIHRCATANVGDRVSTPLIYFDEFKDCDIIDILCDVDEAGNPSALWQSKFDEADAIVVGGGGLLEMPKFEPGLARILNSGKKVIFWGLGHNRVRMESWAGMRATYTLDLSKVSLLGTRDFGLTDSWVPCASSLSKLFDAKYEITNDVVFFANRGMAGNSQYIPTDIPPDRIMGNDRRPMDEIVKFLGSAELVVTSSYHGAYWATLLGRKVVTIPTSSKFYSLKHPVPFCNRVDWKRFANLARTYPDALLECREANLAFFQKAMNLISA